MESDKLAKYKTSPEEYAKFLKRLRHIAAVFLNHPVKEEPRIFIDATSPEYEESTGLIRFTGELRRYVGSGINIDIRCPLSFIDNASDEEISSWVQEIINRQEQANKDKNSVDGRIRHITAVLLDSLYSEPFIIVNYETFEYVKETGDIHFKGSIVYGTGGPSNEIDISFPFHFLRDGTDEEIIKWRDNPKYDEPKLIDVNLEKPLSTNASLSKDQLIEYLQKADIPGDAECTLQFDDGKFYLYFYWSEGAGAFGHTAVNFDIESKELVSDAWSYMERD